jgi:NAD(P)-dependent dehydrogenase (short-subunit alcohol dehydrogenase family)
MSTRTANRELHGIVVAITGGARGIGSATANAFARRGAVVAIGDLDAARARVAAEGIGSEAIGLAFDVTDRALVAATTTALPALRTGWCRCRGRRRATAR